MDTRSLCFPFSVAADGGIRAVGGDEAIRAKILQVLFTAPGERAHHPSFGCGLLNLVFEPGDEILRAATEFTVGQALMRWLRDDISLDRVDVKAQDDHMIVEVAYTKKVDRQQQGLRIQFR